jgi:O-antigen biosynthesis protein WbqP
MRIDTPEVATHLLNDADQWLTPPGAFLRKSSIDELPQIWCIITGEMSFVGPRPALYNQNDLIELRTQKGVHALTPGLTGWAQINGRDEISIEEKAVLDKFYLENASLIFDLKIMAKTLKKVFLRENVTH